MKPTEPGPYHYKENENSPWEVCHVLPGNQYWCVFVDETGASIQENLDDLPGEFVKIEKPGSHDELASEMARYLWEVSRLRHALFTPVEFQDIVKDRLRHFFDTKPTRPNPGLNKVREMRYITALSDAIRRPMGVVPNSADGLVYQEDLDAAEERRPKGGVE